MGAPLLRQASCIAINGRAILIEGPPGSGKSSLALALIDRGAMLIGDDGTTLSVAEEALIAGPPPRLAGCLEIRNVGIVSLPVSAPSPVALVLTLDPAAPRFIEQANTVAILGLDIPAVALGPDTPYLALRAEWALRVHGLGSTQPSAQKGGR